MFVCLFDIDGTLIASGGAGKAALEAGFTEEFGVSSVSDKLSLSGRTDRSIVRDLLDRPGAWERRSVSASEPVGPPRTAPRRARPQR